ncbi:26 kDa periplasmic immunogenic protein precursor [Thalassovita autumnalis]|uniref:26 kDa periplasmic immunogenic protein n=1 Tax=Thalassovita autumnalis TaxID=2072972 RepID=A0A0N7LXW6_9RHOB|nr:SIMPL domain-containing protein [Thalassovita autumnalis]CUH69657.1 26 kDa periplasmic immunogenic protein precursor [Thalassovita autumnalis]CUH73060.1 26 kDa periplasmic immunogenic protein precursor [Thalassovita autumnalis]
MKLLHKMVAPAMVAAMMAVPAAGWADMVRHITVTGEGVVAATPDMATISLGVQQMADTPEIAMMQTAQASQAVVSRLKMMGIAEADMQTSNLSLHQVENYDRNNQPRIEGYRASNSLRVQVRDLDQLGPVLTAALQDGANNFGGLSFGLSEPRPAQDQARQTAMKDALAKAALYAESAGVELGNVVSISEAGSHDVPMPMMRMEMAVGSDMAVEAGELSLNQQVTVVLELK